MNFVQATNELGWALQRFDGPEIGWRAITQPMTRDLAVWMLGKLLPGEIEYRVGKALEPRG